MSWTTSLPHLQQSPTLGILRVLARMRNQSTWSAGIDGTLPYEWHQVMQRIMKYCPCIKKLMFYYERKSNVLISSTICVCVCVCVSYMLVTQSCPTLCNPMDCNSPDFSVHGNFQARILEWVAIPFSRRSPRPRD